MSKFTDIVGPILTFEESWEGKSGKHVEDFICRTIENLTDRDKTKDVNSMQYNSENLTLTLYNEDGQPIASETVSVATPTYAHNIAIEQIYIDDQNVTNNETILCKLGSKILLKIRYTLTAENPLTGKINHLSGKQKLFINMDNLGFVEIPEGITSSAEILELDITKYYNKTTVANVSLKAITNTGVLEESKQVIATTSKPIQVLNPIIVYNNDYVINGFTTFNVIEGGGLKYSIRYTTTTKEGTSLLVRGTDLGVSLEEPGLNQVLAYVVLSNNESIASKPILVQLINIKGQTVFPTVQCAINEVSHNIINWEYSKLYKITLYTKGLKLESILINTKLTNTADSGDVYFDKNKEISLLEVKNSIYQEDICYFFGLDAVMGDLTTNLIVNVDNNPVVSFDDTVQLNIDNDASFTYTKGYTYAFDQFDPENSNIITKDIIKPLELPDGLILDNNLTSFRVSARTSEIPILEKDLASELTNAGFTFELDFKTSNISDPNQPILKVGKFVLYPTELNWQFTEFDNAIDKTARSALFLEDVRTHLLIEVVPNFKTCKRELPKLVTATANRTINIVRVFINGCIDREYKYNTLSDFYTDGFKLLLNPKTADIDIYGLRVYNKALTLSELFNNYLSTVSNIEDKIKILEGNDIVSVDTNNETYISYAKAKSKYNTLLYIMPKDVEYPHLFSWTKGSSPKLKGCTVFVNYVNSPRLPYQYDEDRINKCSGRFTGVEIKGQGTSAMKYYWYNISMKGNFTSNGCYDAINLTYNDPGPESNLLYNSKTYYMPEDTGDSIGITKIVGKTNYASSMLSHKLGATRAYHDLWDACVNKDDFRPEEIRGRKAVLEDPFLVFYIESDKEDLSALTPADIQTINDADIKFATFQTWGSAKGDKATTGYDGDLDKEFLMLEGAENNGKLANFLTPWMPDCIVLDDETYKTKELLVSESNGRIEYSYNLKDSLDVDFGLMETNSSSLTPEASKTMEKFIEAYNFTYLHAINFVPYKETYSLNDPRNNITDLDGTRSALDVTKKYYITNSRYNDSVYFPGKLWDVFRFDLYSNMWVPAGLPVMTTKTITVPNEGAEDGGTHTEEIIVLKVHPSIVSPEGAPVFDYEVFNIKELYAAWGGKGADKIENFKAGFIEDFKKHFNEYYHKEDIIYHQAFIKLFAGTDNRAKNTYFKMFDSTSKIQMLQDDLDTILATDNRGLLKKPYFLLEPSLETEEEYKKMWGGSSAFFELVDIAYEDEIVAMLKTMLDKFNIIQEPSINNWMYKYFYFVLDYFPATSYNHTARLAYESAQIFYDNLKDSSISWGNNGQDPISQAHGSCVESEKEFMKKRLIMFLSLVQISNIFGREAMGINIKAKEDAGSSSAGQYPILITPYQHLYLGFNAGSNPGLYSTARLVSDVPYTVTVRIDPTTPLYSILGNNYIKKFDNFSNIVWKEKYKLSAKRIVEMVGYNPELGKAPFQPSEVDLETPVLTKLDLRHIKSLSTINLDSNHTPKLKEVYLTGTSIERVDLPKGSRLEIVHFPKTLKNLAIYNNPGLKDVQFESLDNIEEVYIDCSKCGKFDVADFCKLISTKPSLSKLTLRNANHLRVTEEELTALFSTDLDITGIIDIVIDVKSSELLDIKFNTLQTLVNKFGDVTSDENRIKVNYKVSNIDSFTAANEISVFYQGGLSGDITFGNLFAVNIAHGNNIKIQKGANLINPEVLAYVAIKYSLNCSSAIAEINSQTGAIVLHKESDIPAQATITITRVDGHVFTHKTTVNFTWKAPEIGDFAYADGTFEGSYNPNKTMVGLVYARDMDPGLTSGTVYIVGKEYVESDENGNYFVGYADDGILGSSDPIRLGLNKVKDYLTKLNILTTYGNVNTNDVASVISVDNIIATNYNEVSNMQFKGSEDTKLYIDKVNKEFLNVVKAVPVSSSPTGIRGISTIISPYLKSVSTSYGTSYYIDSLRNLNDLIAVLPLTTTDSTLVDSSENILGCLLFPYFYGVYLYEPTVKEGEVLSANYAKNKWFCPSAHEMARIIYYRGISANGDNFTDNREIHNNIKPVSELSLSGLQSKKEELRIPIFSKALQAMTAVGANNFPEVWKVIANNNNLTTSTSSSNPDSNYSYLEIHDYESRYEHKWVLGKGLGEYGGYEDAAMHRAWRLTKHKVLPFTQCKFNKF